MSEDQYVSENLETLGQVDLQNETIQKLAEITQLDNESAKNMLEAFGWDLDSAVAMYIGDNVSSDFPTNLPPTPPPILPSNARDIIDVNVKEEKGGDGEDGDDSDDDSVDEENAGARLLSRNEFIEAFNSLPEPPMPSIFPADSRINPNAMLQEMLAASSRFHNFDENFAEGETSPLQRKVDEYDEDGIRKPDNARQSRLIDSRFAMDPQEAYEFAVTEDPSIDWIYPLASKDLSFQGTLDQAREKGAKEARWVLVNIQAHDQFQSHELNRDTWSNDAVIEMLNGSFLFWQRGHTTGQGKQYLQRYKMSEDDLPHIAVVDPRTGAKLSTMKGFLTPDELIIKLLEFCEIHTLEDMKVKIGGLSKSTSTNNLIDDKNSLNGSVINLKESDPDDATKKLDSNVITTSNSDTESEVFEDKLLLTYGPIPDEPTLQSPSVVRISIKLPDGKRLVRKYDSKSKVRGLFAVTYAQLQATNLVEKGRKLELVAMMNSRKELSIFYDMTIEECDLGGAILIAQWK